MSLFIVLALVYIGVILLVGFAELNKRMKELVEMLKKN